MIGIYIHVPFCLRKCPYCDFYSVCHSDEKAEAYTEAVLRNLKGYRDYGISADTVYFGGGTPSLLSSEQLDRILSACSQSFKLCSPEITVECNPSSVTYEKLSAYKSAGVNRLSFGIQTADNSSLQWLGRLHSFESASCAVENAAKAGFDNISCDLMLGLAGQTERSLTDDISKITSLPICHASAYMLKIEKGTAFDCDSIRNSAADEERVCARYLQAVEQFESRGFLQYEISNFALKGMESMHNNKYWQCEEYLGIGPGAHSFWGGKRYACPKNLDSFISQPLQDKIITDENSDRLEEYIMLGLRLKSGITLCRAGFLGMNDYQLENMRRKALLWSAHGLCSFDGDVISLTPNGFLVSNQIISQLLE